MSEKSKRIRDAMALASTLGVLATPAVAEAANTSPNTTGGAAVPAHVGTGGAPSAERITISSANKTRSPEQIVKSAATDLARLFADEYRKPAGEREAEMKLTKLDKAGKKVRLKMLNSVRNGDQVGTYSFSAIMPRINGRLVPDGTELVSMAYAEHPDMVQGGTPTANTKGNITYSLMMGVAKDGPDPDQEPEWYAQQKILDGAGSVNMQSVYTGDPKGFNTVTFDSISRLAIDVNRFQAVAHPLPPHNGHGKG